MQRHCLLKRRCLWGFECRRLGWRGEMAAQSDGGISRVYGSGACWPTCSAKRWLQCDAFAADGQSVSYRRFTSKSRRSVLWLFSGTGHGGCRNRGGARIG